VSPSDRERHACCQAHGPRARTATAGARSLYGAARVSAARAVIAEAVVAEPGAFTAEDLHATPTVRSAGVGLATVYRALAAMQDAGAIAPVGERGGSALLARCTRGDHHHHFVCTSCGSVAGVDCPLGDAARDSVERDGRLVTRHEITLYGLCATCRASGGDA